MSRPVTDIIVLEENRANHVLFEALAETAKKRGASGLLFLTGDKMVKSYVRGNCHDIMVIIRSFASTGSDKGKPLFERATNLRDTLIALGIKSDHAIILRGDETPEMINLLVLDVDIVDVII